MSFIKRLFTRESRTTSEIIAQTQGNEKTTTARRFDDWPDFTLALEAYRNPMIAAAVDNTVAGVLSSGFFFTSENQAAADRVARWAERTGLRSLLFEIVREVVLCGNSFLKPDGRGENMQLHRIPLTWFRPELDVVVEGEKVRVVNYYIDVRVGTHYERRKLPADEVIHFAFNILDPTWPWGHGIAYQIVTRQRDWKGRETPSLLESEATLRRDLILFMDRSVPKRILRFDVGDAELRERIIPQFSELLREPGTDMITNNKFEMTELKPPERLRFEYYQIFENMFTAALRSPIVKLFTTPGFTEASAREATRVWELYVNAVREYVEHVLETKVFPLVTSEKVEIHWGQPERPELSFTDIFAATKSDAYNPAIISRDEARRMLRELGWMLEAEEGEAGEALGRGKIVDTLDEVEIYLVPVDDVDKNTVRYYTLDSERGVSMAVALVKSRRERIPVAIFFDKKFYPWTVDKARDYYVNVFPTLLEKVKYV